MDDPDVPRGAALILKDGRRVACTLTPRPERDGEGMAVWEAYPVEPVNTDEANIGHIDYLPGMTTVVFVLDEP